MRRIALATLVAMGAPATLACGGTTGRDSSLGATGNDTTSDATSAPDVASFDGGANADATLADDSLYTGAFDVVIPFADRALPDVTSAPDGGSPTASEGGSDLPNCPAFLFVDSDGSVIGPEGGTVAPPPLQDQIPADYTSDGGVMIATDASPCATYPWLGSVAADQCLISRRVTALFTAPYLPPCNWALEAGVAVQGSRTGDSRYKICMDLYRCIMRTGCFLGTLGGTAPAPNPGACFCGDLTGNASGVSYCVTNPKGPCLAEELAGLELPGQNPASQAATALGEFGSLSMPGPGSATRWLNALFVALDGHLAIGHGNCVDLVVGSDASGD
jgi:hypothetical protein